MIVAVVRLEPHPTVKGGLDLPDVALGGGVVVPLALLAAGGTGAMTTAMVFTLLGAAAVRFAIVHLPRAYREASAGR